MGQVLVAAITYQRHGWSVVPIAPRAKRPLVAWTDFQRRIASEVEITAWFARWPDANLGIVTGSVSGLVVIDIDPSHGGTQSLLRIEAPHGALPATVEVLTGGGGRHLYFRHPGHLVANRVGAAPGIDLRADGGLVVAPPSIHPSGRPYRFALGRSPDSMPLAALPAWLMAAVDAPTHGHPVGYWRTLLKAGVKEGGRNSAIASLTGHLLWHGVDPMVATELLLCWNAVRADPPMSSDEVARTVDSVRRLRDRHQDPRPENPEAARDKS